MCNPWSRTPYCSCIRFGIEGTSFHSGRWGKRWTSWERTPSIQIPRPCASLVMSTTSLTVHWGLPIPLPFYWTVCSGPGLRRSAGRTAKPLPLKSSDLSHRGHTHLGPSGRGSVIKDSLYPEERPFFCAESCKIVTCLHTDCSRAQLVFIQLHFVGGSTKQVHPWPPHGHCRRRYDPGGQRIL